MERLTFIHPFELELERKLDEWVKEVLYMTS
jgi:hypothetical protein